MQHPLSVFKLLYRSILLSGLLLLSVQVFSQRNNVKVAWQIRSIDFGYERVFTKNQSFILGFVKSNFLNRRFSQTGLSTYPMGERQQVHLGYRRYLNPQKVMHSWYVGSSVAFGSADAEARKKNDEIHNIPFTSITFPGYTKGTTKELVGSLGMNVGLQYRWKKLNLDTGLRIDYNHPFSNNKMITLDDESMMELPNYIRGFRPGAYLGLGYAF